MSVCIHIHAHTHTCTHACTHARMHACTHARIHAHTHTRMHTCTHARMHAYLRTHIHASTHTYTHTRIHPPMQLYRGPCESSTPIIPLIAFTVPAPPSHRDTPLHASPPPLPPPLPLPASAPARPPPPTPSTPPLPARLLPPVSTLAPASGAPRPISVCSASVPESTSDELLPPSLLATTEARRTLCARFPGKAVACAVAGGRFLALASPRAWAVDDVARWEAWCAAFLTTSRTTRPLGVTCAEASDAFGASLWSLLRFWFARWMLYLRVVESSRQPRSHGPPAQPVGPHTSGRAPAEHDIPDAASPAPPQALPAGVGVFGLRVLHVAARALFELDHPTRCIRLFLVALQSAAAVFAPLLRRTQRASRLLVPCDTARTAAVFDPWGRRHP